MAQKTILYWRDIPAQVIVKQGRRSAKRELAARFQEAIDLAAMRAGAIGTDAYLNDWRRGPAMECDDDDLEGEVERCAKKIENEYDSEKIAKLVANYGHTREAG